MTEETSPSFQVPERPGRDEAAALLDQVRALPEGAKLELEASSVDEMSTAFVLAVVSSARKLAEGGSGLAIAAPSEPFVDAFSELGLFQDLMKMEFRQ